MIDTSCAFVAGGYINIFVFYCEKKKKNESHLELSFKLTLRVS